MPAAGEESIDDSSFLTTSPDALLDAVRSFGSGGGAAPVERYILRRAGLVDGDELTEAGKALFKLAWVLRKQSDAEVALGQALRVLVPLQVIEQELRGLGAVPEEGVVDLLRHHRAIPDSITPQALRKTWVWLNKVGVVVYSQKMKTVRSVAPAPEAALAGEVRAIAGMISPRTPYSNVVRLRRVLRTLQGTAWWVDAHFGARALEELAVELEPGRVTAIRIISGDAENILTDRSMKDFGRFQAEMADRAIVAEWRVDDRAARNWHDRWIADDKNAWNVPPVNNLFKNDYSEIFPASERPPLEDWWSRSAARS